MKRITEPGNLRRRTSGDTWDRVENERIDESKTKSFNKEFYKLYGEYLANLRQPYPEHLVPRKDKGGG